MTDSMPFATVGFIRVIQVHPNADRLEVITVELEPPVPGINCPTVSLVTGKHYRIGDLGVWLRPGGIIPGWLAHDLWMVGKKRSNEPFEVREIEIRGVPSPGLWAGQWYRNDNSKESLLRADEMARGGGKVVDGWISWARWNDAWKVGDHVDDALGVTRPPSSVAEQPVVNRQVAAETTASSRPLVGQGDVAVEALGSTPAVGSTTHNSDPGDEG